MGYATIRTKALKLEPIEAANAPMSSIYKDSATNSFTTKSSSGSSAEIATALDAFVKKAMNGSGQLIPANTPVSRLPDGTIAAADSDSATGQSVLGVSLEPIAVGFFGSIGLIGRNIPSALASFNFQPGQDLYVSQSGGYTSDPSSFTGDDDSIILIGIADTADLSSDATAPDLILLRQILVRP